MKNRLLSLFMAVCLTLALFSGLGPRALAAEDAVKGYLISYTVKAGDTIYGICQDKGIDFDKNLQLIAKVNGLTNYNYMTPGKKLWLPSTTASTGGAYYTLLSHTLVYGESPAALCQSYGVDFNTNYNLISGLNDNLGTFMAGQNFLLPLLVNPKGTAVTPATAAAAAESGMAAGGAAMGDTGAGNAAGAAATGTGAAATTATTGTAAATPVAGADLTPAQAAAIVAGNSTAYYLAQRVLLTGETVSGVCAGMGINFDEYANTITTLNNILNYNNIAAGTTLLLPTATVPSSGSYYRVVKHTVTTGETLTAICTALGIDFGTYLEMIQRLNNRNDFTMLYAGDTLFIPVYVTAGGAAAPAAGAAGTTTTTTTTTTVTNPGTPAMAAGGEAMGDTGSGQAAGGAAMGDVGGAPATTTTTTTTTTTNQPGTAGNTLKGDTVDRYIAVHQMKTGETVSGVCAGLGVDFDSVSYQISTLNGITYFNGVQAGQNILIPTGTVPASGPYYKVIRHTLVTGDTVSGLCTSYGIDLAKNTDLLQKLNNKANILTDLFYVGQTILIPVYVAG